jgi:hypothetical protein
MMEAVRTSETSVDNHFTRQYHLEDSSEQHRISAFIHPRGRSSSAFEDGSQLKVTEMSIISFAKYLCQFTCNNSRTGEQTIL